MLSSSAIGGFHRPPQNTGKREGNSGTLRFGKPKVSARETPCLGIKIRCPKVLQRYQAGGGKADSL